MLTGKTAGNIIVGLSGAAGALSLYAITTKVIAENKVKDAVKTTTNISVKDFAKVEKAVNEGTITWEHALDSLKAESKIQKSYFEGAQMVRDSIKNATKVAKAIK